MLKNYIKIAIRSLVRRKVYATLNIVGLSTGLACALFIYNWVSDETTFDEHIPENSSVYRVVAEVGAGGDRWHQAVTSIPLGETMKTTFPEVISRVRIDKNDAVVEKDKVQYRESDILLTDPDFFELFGYRLKAGNELTALSEPYQLVITQSMAQKYFGTDNPIGQALKIYQYDPDGMGIDYTITGVIADPPATSHFTFSFLASISTMESFREGSMANWGENSYYTYVKLVDGTDAMDLEDKLPEMVNLHLGDILERHDLYYRFYLQPVTSIHLHSDIQYEYTANGNMEYIWIFSAIGIFILFLAAINYINLSTSFALERAKEIGVRKVLGAFRSNLVRQHLMETLVLTVLSMLIAGLLIEVFKPFFYTLTGKQHLVFHRASILVQLLTLCIPLTVAAGYFPALILANLNTITALKGTVDKKSSNGFRAMLVGFQFVITLIILVGVIVVHQQLQFVQSKDLGYDKSNLLILRVNGNRDVVEGFEVFKNEVQAHEVASQITRAGSTIASGLGNSNGQVQHENGETQFEKLYHLYVDYNYVDTYGMKIVAGRNFSPEIFSDSTEAFVVNEQTARAFGWTNEQAIGQEMNFRGRDGKIVGVVGNFHFNSLHYEIEPVCMYLPMRSFSRIIIKGRQADDKLLSTVQQYWNKHFPTATFDYTFQEQALFDGYAADRKFGAIFNVFSVLSIVIAFLGLFGLIGYTVSKRVKEIGIRKVLGASYRQLLQIIAIDFVKIILVAALISMPIAWYVMDRWLSDFPFRISIGPWVFVVAVGVLIAIAVFITFIQSGRAILSNPSSILKEE